MLSPSLFYLYSIYLFFFLRLFGSLFLVTHSSFCLYVCLYVFCFFILGMPSCLFCQFFFYLSFFFFILVMFSSSLLVCLFTCFRFFSVCFFSSFFDNAFSSQLFFFVFVSFILIQGWNTDDNDDDYNDNDNDNDSNGNLDDKNSNNDNNYLNFYSKMALRRL